MVAAQASQDFSNSDHARRILVAEDSSITQDLLKLVLSQRGHQVDIVNDGEEALNALLNNSYDTALLDFHLPIMDGVQVICSFFNSNQPANRPRFIAITADIEGLLEHKENCELFDEIVPKPVDIQKICKVLDEPFKAREKSEVRTNAPKAKTVRHPLSEKNKEPQSANTPLLSLGYNFLQWPTDFDSKHLSARALQATIQNGEFDAILINEPASMADLALIWQTKGLHLLPVIDGVGALGPEADLDCSKLSQDETSKIAELIEAFHNRRARIHPDLIFTDDIGEKLLGRIYVKEAPLVPVYDTREPILVSYNASLSANIIYNEVRKLANGGFLTPTFFDKFHACGGCGSSHLNVREECPECRSPDLTEEPYLHHFKCAYQGPESDFINGDDLICPKCRKELSHFGRDYDKPGTMIICQSCNHSTSEPLIGFLCLSCNTHTDGDAIETRDIHSYTLTDQAKGFVEGGHSFLGFTQQTLRFAELPFDLVVSLNEEAKRFNEDGTPFALLNITYENEREIEREHGSRQFVDVRNLFLQNLRNEISTGGKVAKGQVYDFALLTGQTANQVRINLDDLCEKATAHLRLDLGVSISVFGPEDLS